MKTISISLSPNTERDDVSLAFSLIFKPWEWKRGKAIKDLERLFRNYFGFKNAFSFNSGRSSLIAILKAMDIGAGDEVIVQAFTCNAAVNPIIHVGARPVYADIDDNLNISALEVSKKITDKTKAVMIQHTFGYPADIDEIRKICTINKIYLIEDCAHALGTKYKDSFCGSFGDASFFSFGRDKIISSVYGGMVTVNNDDLLEKIAHCQKEFDYPSLSWTLQQLLHPVLMNNIVLPLYSSKIGRGILAMFLNLNILSKAVTSMENQGKLPLYFPKRMPNALAILAINQFNKLDRFNEHRKEIAKIYKSLLLNKKEFKVIFKEDKDKEPIYLKFPLLNVNPVKVVREARKNEIYLNDGWFGSVVVPPLTSLEKVCYVANSCPRAEEVCKRILCLPTHINISREDAKRVFDSL